MRQLRICFLRMALAAAPVLCGCGHPGVTGPTINSFKGQLVHEGQPVSFPEGESIQLRINYQSGQSYGIPIKPDGSFSIGWMPVGPCVALLEKKNASGRPGMPGETYVVPETLNIEKGKTQYTIELGPKWKPFGTEKKEPASR